MSTRIKDLTADTSPAGGDRVPIDSTGDGTRSTTLALLGALLAANISTRWVKDVSDAAATTATTKRVFFRNNTGSALTFSAILLNIHNTLAGNDTNFFTIIIAREDGAAGASTTIKSWANSVANGGLTAYVTKDLGALADTTLPAGHVLTVEITKTAAGQVVGVGAVEVVGQLAL